MTSNILTTRSVPQTNSMRPISPSFLGFVVGALLVFCGLVFRTYSMSMASLSSEALRQLGLPFIVAEIAVILYAVRQGFSPKAIWVTLGRPIQWSCIAFLSTFWIGSLLFSQMPAPSFTHNLFFIVHILFSGAVYHSVKWHEDVELERMSQVLGVSLLIFCGMIVNAFIFHPPLDAISNNEIIWPFAIPGFISLRLFGAFCGAIFCLMLGIVLLADERKKLNAWQFFWLGLAAAMTIWSGTRAAVVGSISAFVLLAVLYKIRPSFRATVVMAACLAVSAFLAVSLIPYGDQSFMLITPGDGSSAEAASGGRLSYWTAVWHGYQKVPLFGAGPFASSFLVEKGAEIHVQPHNIILQFLTTWGFPAALLALGLLIVATWHAHKIGLQNRAVLPILLMLDCLLVMSLFDGMMHFAQHMMLVMLSFGMIFGYKCNQLQ